MIKIPFYYDQSNDFLMNEYKHLKGRMIELETELSRRNIRYWRKPDGKIC